MFNRGVSTSSGSTGFNDSLESKYTVAEILSSMTNTTPITPTTLTTTASGNTGSLTGTTVTLTPTTLHNLEQTFLDLQHNTTTSGASSSRAQDLSRESGFVPPLVHPYNTSTTPLMVQIKSEVDYADESSLGSEQDLSISGATGNNWGKSSDDGSYSVPPIDPDTYLVANSRRPTGPRKQRRDDALSTDELQRRKIRRERNKQAAAKCRQRREDHTSRLINETEGLEEEKAQLENQIQTLAQQKEQLEFILQAHNTNCQVLKQKSLKSASSMHVSHRPHPYSTTAVPPITIKPTPPATSNFCSTRPNTLSIPSTLVNAGAARNQPTVTAATGVVISTPSTGISVLNFDHTIVEGHTELTPVVCGPASIVSSSAASCSEQVSRSRRSTDSGSSTEVSSPTLMAL